MDSSFLQNALIFLGAAVVFVPIAKRLGIGSVLGYLTGGIIIGPYVLGFIGSEGEDIMHAAEFGVVMMLFIIGLELNPQSFWNMRKSILGMGLSQMLTTAGLFFVLFYGFMNYSLNVSVAVSLSLSMSSTAIVLQTLKEKGLGQTHAGRSSFAVLLFQDVAVIPVLALLPLLGVTSVQSDQHGTLISNLSAGFTTLIILGAVLFIYIMSKYMINPFLRRIARVRMHELFTAAALVIVIGVAYIMEQVGVSAALGTFMAGVLLANSEFRHELESDIEPFKGLLLGLFFMAVGSTINFELILGDPVGIVSFVLLIMAVKGGVLFAIGRFFKLHFGQNILFALLLSQVGEFAFVLLASAGQLAIVGQETLDFMMAVTAFSMVLSPIFLFINETFIDPYSGVKESETPGRQTDKIHEQNPVIIAGFGHFGSTAGRFLRANGVEATILDNDSDRVDLLRKMGFRVYYGDATRQDLLKSAGAEDAGILISALDSPELNMQLKDVVQKHFPHLKIFMRAKNRYDAYELIDGGLENIYRESLHTSVQMGVDVLSELGTRKYTATRKAQEFIHYDERALKKLAGERHQLDEYILSVRREIELQEKLLSEDAKFTDLKTNSAWDGARRKG